MLAFSGHILVACRLLVEQVMANQIVLPFTDQGPSIAQHNAELINLLWPKERLLQAAWPEGSL